jgi:hypothetical protein
MIRRIAPLVFASAFLAAPAAAPAQPPHDPAGGVPAAARGDSAAAPSQSHRIDGRNHVYTIRTDGGAFEIHASDGAAYRFDSDDGGLFVVDDKGGTPHRVGHDGVLVLRAGDGRTLRVDGDSHRVFVLRAKDGGADRAGDAPRAFAIHARDGRSYRLSALESCGAATPLVDRPSAEGGGRTRIVICGDHERGNADPAAQLERVLERMQHLEGLSDSSKERVTAALREAIEQLHSAH